MKSEKIKIGILGCGYECDEHIHEVLHPWLKIMTKGDYEIIFSFVYCQFSEYIDINGENPIKTPNWYEGYKNRIKYFTTPPPLQEKDARNLALAPLLQEKCDWVILLDIQDELYTEKQIEKIFKILSEDKFVVWLKFSFKNYVFSKNQFLAEAFQPPRAYRVVSGNYKLNSFRFDNEVLYHGMITRDIRPHEQFPSKTIHPNLVWIKHLSWLSDERSKKKVAYQIKHFGSSLCSYKWDDVKNELTFNPEYYARFNKPLPEIIVES